MHTINDPNLKVLKQFVIGKVRAAHENMPLEDAVFSIAYDLAAMLAYDVAQSVARQIVDDVMSKHEESAFHHGPAKARREVD